MYLKKNNLSDYGRVKLNYTHLILNKVHQNNANYI